MSKLQSVFPLETLDGSTIEELTGKVVLFVNVASRCGLTPQYSDLVELSKRYSTQDFEVVGVPCNQFGAQEPGTPEEILDFCSMKYKVDFTLLKKQAVNGSERSDLYSYLVGSEKGAGKDISWNFAKFLVGRSGEVVARFSPQTGPLSEELVAAIDAEL